MGSCLRKTQAGNYELIIELCYGDIAMESGLNISSNWSYVVGNVPNIVSVSLVPPRMLVIATVTFAATTNVSDIFPGDLTYNGESLPFLFVVAGTSLCSEECQCQEVEAHQIVKESQCCCHWLIIAIILIVLCMLVGICIIYLHKIANADERCEAR